MRQRAQCAACASIVYFLTDGFGRVVERCPHCHDHWPLRVTRPAPTLCRHSEPEAACAKCALHRAKCMQGYAAMRADVDPAEFAARRSAAAKKAWETMRARGGRNAA